MAELLRTHPLQAWNAAFERLPGSVGIAVEPFVAMVDIRLGAEAAARLDVDLPAVPSTWMPVGAGRAVWLGPDEWLLTSTTEAPDELEALVRAVVLPLGGAAADVSAHRIGLRLTGPRVRDVLAKGCAIDLHPRVFRRGSSAQTMLGLAGIILLALSDAGDDYVVLSGRPSPATWPTGYWTRPSNSRRPATMRDTDLRAAGQGRRPAPGSLIFCSRACRRLGDGRAA